MGNFIDLTGQRFGRLTVLEYVGTNKRRQALWLCKCECGNTKTVIGSNLRSGTSRSCGCRKKKGVQRNVKHLQTNTRLYHIWSAMKKRCSDPNYEFFTKYGARGITVCDEWRNSFEAFRDWAMANGYQDALSIDRIDPNGNYEPSNCRWADEKTQQNNRTNNHFITFKGKKQTLAQWAEELNVNYNTLSNRLYNGWTIEEALTIPIGGKRKTK